MISRMGQAIAQYILQILAVQGSRYIKPNITLGLCRYQVDKQCLWNCFKSIAITCYISHVTHRPGKPLGYVEIFVFVFCRRSAKRQWLAPSKTSG